MGPVTRRAAWQAARTAPWPDDLIWYAAGVHQMKLLTPRLDDVQNAVRDYFRSGNLNVGLLQQITASWSDPLSWGYQSQVHATFVAASGWPQHLGQGALWHECAHNNWFFLPWHRAYLLEFEAVLRHHIKRLDGPADDWGLPYWNYSDYRSDPRALSLPAEVSTAVLPAGVAVPGVDAEGDGSHLNPLFDPTRLMTAAPPAGSAQWADATDALSRDSFVVLQDLGQESFGGGYLENATQFHAANEPGRLDVQPHGSVHNQVNGSMALFETAGLDPVFWMHHTNIDRLWETWANDLGNGYQTAPVPPPTPQPGLGWATREFEFLRPDGTLRTWNAAGVVDIGTLGYRYDTTAPPPMGPLPPPVPGGGSAGGFGFATSGAGMPEPVASASNVPLGDAADAELTADPTTAQGFGFGEDAERWILRLDGIRAKAPAPTSYEVYLGLGAGEEADPDDRRHYVGLLSLFGVYEATRDASESGQMRLFDITSQVVALGPELDPARPVVRFVPLNPERNLNSAEMSIERISIESA